MKILFSALLFFVGINAFAHGEDVPGPHGGHIRMLGSFHMELAPDENSFHVFLLDMNFKNPTIKDSSVEISLLNGKKKVSFQCEVMGGNHFNCKADEKYDLKKGKLSVKAKREGMLGEISYDLPLKFKEAMTERMQNHSKH